MQRKAQRLIRSLDLYIPAFLAIAIIAFTMGVGLAARETCAQGAICCCETTSGGICCSTATAYCTGGPVAHCPCKS